MSDIVERLRQPWPPSCSEDPLMTEAADEITALRAENERLVALGKKWMQERSAGRKEREALTAEVEKLRAALLELGDYNRFGWTMQTEIARTALEERK